MVNQEAYRRARLARYLLWQAEQLELDPAVFAKALGVTKERLRTLRTVTPQVSILYRMGACLEHIARTGEIPPPPPKRRVRRRRNDVAEEDLIDGADEPPETLID
jgi:hypothetical protein